MNSGTVKKIIESLVKNWDYSCVKPLDEDEIDWIFKETLNEKEISLSKRNYKKAFIFLSESLEKAYNKIKEKKINSSKINDKIQKLKEDTMDLNYSGLGVEKIEIEVNLDKINSTLNDLIQNYGEDYTINAVEQGMEIEAEHSTNEDVQFVIAVDHLAEDPYYYDKLVKMEDESEDNTDSPEDFSSEESMDDFSPEEEAVNAQGVIDELGVLQNIDKEEGMEPEEDVGEEDVVEEDDLEDQLEDDIGEDTDEDEEDELEDEDEEEEKKPLEEKYLREDHPKLRSLHSINIRI